MRFKFVIFLSLIVLICFAVSGASFVFAAEGTENTGIGKRMEDWTASSQDNVSINDDTIYVKERASLKTPLNSDYIKIVFASTPNSDTIEGEWRDFVMVLSDEADLDPVHEFTNRASGNLTRSSLVITVGVRDNQWNVCIGGNVLEQPGTQNAYTWYNITGNDGDAYALSDYTKPIVFEMYLTAENPSIRVSQEGTSFAGYTYTPTNSMIYFVRDWWMQNAMGETYLSIGNYEATESQLLGISSIETAPIDYGTELGVSGVSEWSAGSDVSIEDGIVTVTGQAGLLTPVYVDDLSLTVEPLMGTSEKEYSLMLSDRQNETVAGLDDGMMITLGVKTGEWKMALSPDGGKTALADAVLTGFKAEEPLTVRYKLIGQEPMIEFYSAGVRKSYPVTSFDRSTVAGSDLKTYLSIGYVGSGTAYGLELHGIRTLEAAGENAVGAKSSEWSLSNEFTARQYADGVGVMAFGNTLTVPLESEYIKVDFEIDSVPDMGWFNINFSAADGYMAEGFGASTEAADSGKVPMNPVLGFSFHVASVITHLTTKVFYTEGSVQGDTVHKLTDDIGVKFTYPSGHVMPITYSEGFSIIISMSEENPMIIIEQGRSTYSFSSFNCDAIASGLLTKGTYANEEGKTFLSIGSSSTDFEIKVTGIETSDTAPAIEPPEDVSIVVNATVPKSTPINQEFVLPAPNVVMTGGSGYKTSIQVLDPAGNNVKIVENKFIPDQEGTYRIIYTATDNWGTTDTAEYKLKVANATPPSLVIDEASIPTEGKIGEKIMLPSATITDDSDPNPQELIVVKDPEGKEVIVVNGGFTPEKEGVYTVQYVASDSDNNITHSKVFSITVTAEEQAGCNALMQVSGMAFAGIALLLGVSMIILKKHKKIH